MTAKAFIITLNPRVSHRRLLLACIFDLNLMMYIFPNAPYIEVLTRKSLARKCNWVSWKTSVVLWGPWPQRLHMCLLFPKYMVSRASYFILLYQILIPVKWESLGHSDEHGVSRTNFLYLWQCSREVRSMKSKLGVLAPNPWLCHLLADSQEHL